MNGGKSGIAAASLWPSELGRGGTSGPSPDGALFFFYSWPLVRHGDLPVTHADTAVMLEFQWNPENVFRFAGLGCGQIPAAIRLINILIRRTSARGVPRIKPGRWILHNDRDLRHFCMVEV
jgi:hypothetical protein